MKPNDARAFGRVKAGYGIPTLIPYKERMVDLYYHEEKLLDHVPYALALYQKKLLIRTCQCKEYLFLLVFV